MQVLGFLLACLALQSNAARIRVSSDKLAKRLGVDKRKDSRSRPSPGTSTMDWLLNNMIEIDPDAAEKKLRASQNVLLPPEQEHVVMAFKVGNDKTYFTNNRIIMRPKGWFLSSSTKYQSVPYTSILQFGMQTAGIFPDMDTELWFWTSMPELPRFGFELRKGKSDIFAVIKFINSKVLGKEPDNHEPSLLQKTSAGSPFVDVWHWLSDNAAEVDARHVEHLFKDEYPFLQHDEHVEKAFKVGRDSTLLTNKRLVHIDVTGITGYSVSYESWPWNTIQAFGVMSAGTFDDDCEMTIWTSVPDTNMRKFERDLRGFGRGRVDVLEIQRIFEKYILGNDNSPPVFTPHEIPELEMPNGTVNEIIAWLGDDHAQMNGWDAEARLRAAAHILQDDEHVELAFMKSKFERDVIYLTTKRILIADIKKLFLYDDKIQYLSIPYRAIDAFEGETAAYLDFDSHFSVYTKITPPPPKVHCVEVKVKRKDGDGDTGNARSNDTATGGDEVFDDKHGHKTRIHNGKATETKCTLIPIPGKSKIDVDLRWSECIFDIQKLLYYRVLRGSSPDLDMPLQQTSELHPSLLHPVSLYHWLDGNAKEIDTAKAEAEVQSAGKILQDGEKVQKAFTTWRDLTLLTSTRVLIVDAQYFALSRKVVYTSVPYSSIHGFGVRTGGTFDFDAEIMFYTSMPWLPSIQQDLRRGTSDIAQIQHFLCDKVVGSHSPSLLETGIVKQESGPVGDFLDWLGSNHGKIEVSSAMARLQSDPPVLLEGESIKLAYKVYHDMTMFTSHRILVVNVADFDLFSKKVEYRTIPYAAISGFSVETASNYFDRDEEVIAHTSMPDLKKVQLDIAAGSGDIFDVQMLLSQRIIA